MNYTVVGTITNTHGIRGEVKVFPITDDVNRFSNLKKIYLGDRKIQLDIERVKYHKGLAIIKFKQYNNINEIISFKNQFIYVDDESKVVLPENHFFISELLNCDVYNMDGEKLGYIKDIMESSSNDVYIVRDDSLNKEYLIPAVKEFIKSVNLDDKKIIINPIEGMIE